MSGPGRTGATQCQICIENGRDVSYFDVERYVDNLPREGGVGLTVHKKAVPAMMGGLQHQSLSWRNGKWPTQGSGLASDGAPSH